MGLQCEMCNVQSKQMSNSNFQIGLYKLITEDYLLLLSLYIALKSTLWRRSISELVPTLIFDTRAVDLSQTNCTLNLSLDCQCNHSATTGHSAEWLYCFSQYFIVVGHRAWQHISLHNWYDGTCIFSIRWLILPFQSIKVSRYQAPLTFQLHWFTSAHEARQYNWY